MCGIAGVIDPGSSPAQREEGVARMCAAMVHRGPDDSGLLSAGSGTIGMRRLAIFDPANGHQPMTSPDGRLSLVFNGAIYNFRTLREELAQAGWAFRTQCDTEVLLAAYATWGEACLPRLRGMYAFAAWDHARAELFLARDPLGIKPLYLSVRGPRLAFASEVQALRRAVADTGSLDPGAVIDHLAWLAVPAPRTLFAGIRSLGPGECGVWREGRLQVRPAWKFGGRDEDHRPCATRSEFVTELRARLEDSVRAHVLADVPVGAFLSGGLDSAAVVGLMTRVGGARLRTFAIDFAEAGFSEADAAAASARHFGAEHTTTTLTGSEVARDLDRLLAAMDQPTGDGLNTYYASRAARAGGVTVALSGLGGDELFGGYPSFRTTPRLARWLPLWRLLPGPARSAVIARLQAGDTLRRKLADALAHARNLHEVAALQRRVLARSSLLRLLAPDLRPLAAAASPFHPALAAVAAEAGSERTFSAVSAWELRTYMADVLLRDSDVMSMRHSLELRVPLIDRPLIEWLWRQPDAFKADSRQPKSVLREALHDLLPPDLASRRKWGFSLPMTVWMKRELRPFLDDTFAEASVRRCGFFDAGAVRAAWENFVRSDDTREWSRLWNLAVLIAFANRPADSRS